jgi:transcription antitermination factor NusG
LKHVFEAGQVSSPWAAPIGLETEQGLADYAPAWFAVFTTSRHEKRVAEHCVHREIESFLPLYRKTSLRSNRCKVTVELPLFPGYLFTHIDRRERVRLLNIPGVVSVIGCTRDAVPIPDDCIHTLRRGLSLGLIQPHANLIVGERVRIKDGPMMGAEGILVRIKNDVRVVLRLESIMKSVAIEVGRDDVEPAR